MFIHRAGQPPLCTWHLAHVCGSGRTWGRGQQNHTAARPLHWPQEQVRPFPDIALPRCRTPPSQATLSATVPSPHPCLLEQSERRQASLQHLRPTWEEEPPLILCLMIPQVHTTRCDCTLRLTHHSHENTCKVGPRGHDGVAFSPLPAGDAP